MKVENENIFSWTFSDLDMDVPGRHGKRLAIAKDLTVKLKEWPAEEDPWQLEVHVRGQECKVDGEIDCRKRAWIFVSWTR